MALWKNSRYLSVSDVVIAISPKTNTQKSILGIRLIDRNIKNKEIHLTTGNDNLFQLALTYYNDARLWWKIADANPVIEDPYEIPSGIELVIPILS